MSTLGERLLQLKAERGLLQKEIAKDVGLALRTYQYYETGERTPDAKTIVALADYFNIPADYLLGRGVFENWEQVIQFKDVITDKISKDTKLDMQCFDDAAFMRIMYAIVERITVTDSDVCIYYALKL